jgi:hypothetical protein
MAWNELFGRQCVPVDRFALSRGDDVDLARLDDQGGHWNRVRKYAPRYLGAAKRVQHVDSGMLPPERIGVGRRYRRDDDGRASDAHLIDASCVIGAP